MGVRSVDNGTHTVAVRDWLTVAELLTLVKSVGGTQTHTVVPAGSDVEKDGGDVLVTGDRLKGGVRRRDLHRILYRHS